MERMKIVGVGVAEGSPSPAPCLQCFLSLLIPPLWLSGHAEDWQSLIISSGYQLKEWEVQPQRRSTVIWSLGFSLTSTAPAAQMLL